MQGITLGYRPPPPETHTFAPISVSVSIRHMSGKATMLTAAVADEGLGFSEFEKLELSGAEEESVAESCEA